MPIKEHLGSLRFREQTNRTRRSDGDLESLDCAFCPLHYLDVKYRVEVGNSS